MAIARNQLVDTSLTRWYHCITRLVRRASLLGEGGSNRKMWVETGSRRYQRVDHVATSGQTAQLEAAKGGSVAGSQAAAGLEESLWLCPIEDRRGLDSTREGMVQGFSLISHNNLSQVPGIQAGAGRSPVDPGPTTQKRGA